jgi:SAM-dependent methyltransferase
MSRWEQTVTRTAGDAKRFWESASLDTLYQMMEPAWAWQAWLNVAAGIITEPGSVFEPGCGIGTLADLLPEGCSYYGCDINPAYIDEAHRLRSGPDVQFEVRDLDDVLSSGERFDWVVVTSLLGMFPEEIAYELMPRFWAAARRGMSLTTIDKQRFPRSRRLRFDFAAHDPVELLAAARSLPGVGVVEVHKGSEDPAFRGHHWSRGLALYAWRDGRMHASDHN